MENSSMEAVMAIGKNLSETTQHPSEDEALKKQNSILSLTLDEIQCKSGKNFWGMSMDELLANIWNVEESQIHSQNHQFFSNLHRQGSFSIPIPLCGKTVDEIWSEIHKDQQTHHQKFMNINQNPCQTQQQVLGEMTLEDFLVKAGVVQESNSSSSGSLMKQMMNNFGSNHRSSLVDLGFGGMGEKLGLSLSSYQQCNARNLPTNCFGTYQMLQQTVGESSNGNNNNSIQKCHSSNDWVQQSNKRRVIDGAPEVIVQRRQRRMIKNRESAARSRARKQAYTVELEVELNQLKEENVKLKQIVAESEKKRKQEVLQRKQTVKRQKPAEKLKTLRRIASMTW